MDSSGIGLPFYLFAKVFPFHLVFNRQMELIQLGSTIERICQVHRGSRLDQHFRINRPNVSMEFDAILAQSDSVYLLESLQNGIILNGQIVYCKEADYALYLGSPMITELKSLDKLGLSLKDFAIQDDPDIDFLFLIQSQSTALADVKRFAAKLKKARDKLEERVEERTAELSKANAILKQQISERKRTEEALRTSREYLDTILLNLPAGVAILKGPDFRYSRINHVLAKINGLPVEDHLGRPLAEVLPDAAPVILPNLRQVLETGEDSPRREFSARLPKDPDKVRHFIDSFFPIKGPAGETEAVGVVVLDITERKEAAEALQQSEQRFKLAVQGSNDGMWDWPDITKDDEWWSPRWYELLGYQDGEVEASYSKFGEFLHPDDVDSMKEALRAHFEERVPFDMEYRLRTKSGEYRWFRGRGQALWDDEGNPTRMSGSLQDITERKQLEKQILDIHENVQHQIGRDLHDSLGQHLTGLAFKAKVFQEKLQAKSLPEADKAAEIVALTNQAISQARSLARGLYPVLLGVEGLESALSELTTDIGNLFGIRCDFKSDMRVKISTNGKTIHLYRIAQEAINNAIHHGKAKQIWVELTTVNKKSVMKIKSDGYNFPENPDRKQGMGLAIMNYRARMINASLAIHSDVNGGTAVTCTFS